jgi:hypothetical protein
MEGAHEVIEAKGMREKKMQPLIHAGTTRKYKTPLFNIIHACADFAKMLP